MAKSEGDSGVKKAVKIAVQLLDIGKAHKKHIYAGRLHSLIPQKLVISRIRG